VVDRSRLPLRISVVQKTNRRWILNIDEVVNGINHRYGTANGGMPIVEAVLTKWDDLTMKEQLYVFIHITRDFSANSVL
jgi:hypothetical protein